MHKINIITVLTILMLGCIPTDVLKKADQVVVTNSILETKIIGDGILDDTINNISITVKPIDTRLFDHSINSNSVYDGSHKSIISTVNGVNYVERDTSKIARIDNLKSKLVDEGLSNREINTVISSIFDDKGPIKNLFVYTDPNIYLDDTYGASNSNPFTMDKRYLTVVEVLVENKSNTFNTVCEEDIFITGNSILYNNIPTKDLLLRIPTGTVYHEVLYTLLMNNCETIPANSIIKKHLVFPYFYDNEELTIHYKVGNTLIEKNLNIENKRVKNLYMFSNMTLSITNKKGYRITTRSSSSSRNYNSQSSTRRYHFVRVNGEVKFLGNEDFFIHDDIDLSSAEVLSVKYLLSGEVEIYRKPITKEDISEGSVIVVEN